MPRSPGLSPALVQALRKRGIEQLYAHQAQAFEAAVGGRHVVVATPTASGKSLCFHLPVLEALSRESDASAIYLYPTKALSRDQEAGLRQLIGEAGLSIPAVVYDGDTPGDARRAARERSPIVMTNPDMLHAGILPHHAHWARTLQKLRYVVIDELHTYRGVFGSHVAHVIARLRRAARFHGADPIFLCATATIGNPREHAARLLGVEEERVALVDESGAPCGSRRLFVYNPPVVNAELGIRASTLKSAVRLAADLVRAKVPTIVFGQSRNSVEIMLKYLRDKLAEDKVDPDAIMAYRGGYLPETRRRVEQGLRNGDILCVVATNALELGIDIGELDAVICAGYPGSVAGAWQRFGRAGRRGSSSIAVMVASSSSLDQYLARNPDYLFDSDVESARIDPHNTEILIQHLKCAAFELPFLSGEAYAGMVPADTDAALHFSPITASSTPRGPLSLGDRRLPCQPRQPPQRGLGQLRDHRQGHGKGPGRARLARHPDDAARAGHLPARRRAIPGRAPRLREPQGLRHQGRPRLFHDRDDQPQGLGDGGRSARPLGRATVAWGEVSVVEKVTGYKKIKFYTHENAGYGEVRLPDIQMHTTSFWLTIPESLCEEVEIAGAPARPSPAAPPPSRACAGSPWPWRRSPPSP